MNFFTDKIDNIRNTITNVQRLVLQPHSPHPKKNAVLFNYRTGRANKLITTSKPTTCLLDPVPTKLLKELPVAEEPLLNIINSSLSLGHVPKTIQAGSY